MWITSSFSSSSPPRPGNHVRVQERLARWAQEFLRPHAYVIDDTGFPKDGADSPRVARMYCGALGKVGNCQIGVSVHAVTDWASAAINWRLFLPKSWDDAMLSSPAADSDLDADVVAEIRRRRARTKIPDQVRHREKWRLALDMLDQITNEQGAGQDGARGWGVPQRPVVADAGYGDNTEFRLGLQARGLPYVVAVKPTTSAHPLDATPTAPTDSGRGCPPTPRYRDPSTLAALAVAAARRCARSPGATARGAPPATRTAAMRSRFNSSEPQRRDQSLRVE